MSDYGFSACLHDQACYDCDNDVIGNEPSVRWFIAGRNPDLQNDTHTTPSNSPFHSLQRGCSIPGTRREPSRTNGKSIDTARPIPTESNAVCSSAAMLALVHRSQLQRAL